MRKQTFKTKAESDKIQKETEQIYGQAIPVRAPVQNLPEIFAAVQIDHYIVTESESESASSPVIKLLNEIMFVIKNFSSKHDKSEQ